MQSVLSKIPLLIIVVTIALILHFQLWHYLSFDSLRYYYHGCARFVARHFWLALFYFCLTYFIIAVTSIPGGVILTLLGGFLFGSILATILVVISATCGATVLVIAVRLAFGETLAHKIGNKVKFMEKNLDKNVFFYLLSLRLFPVIPFFLVNLAAGVFDIRLKDFFLATLIGIIPASFIYANIGSSLGSLLNDTSFTLNRLITFPVVTAFASLALFALLPVFIRYLRK